MNNDDEVEHLIHDFHELTGYALLEMRLAAGMKQNELAKRSGISVKTICMIEKGSRNFTIDIIPLLLKAMNADIITFIHYCFFIFMQKQPPTYSDKNFKLRVCHKYDNDFPHYAIYLLNDHKEAWYEEINST